MMAEMKEDALKNGTELSYKMGAWEIMQIVYASVEKYREIADADQTILKALRRNGQLAYCIREGKMTKITEENSPWIKEIGDGQSSVSQIMARRSLLLARR